MNERHVFVAHGDIAQMSADAVAYSTSVVAFERWHGDLFSAFDLNFADFKAKFQESRKTQAAGRRYFDLGESFWLPLSEEGWQPTEAEKGGKPYGIVIVAAGGKTKAGEPPVEVAVRKAIAEAARQLEALFPPDTFPDRRFLLALPAFRLGKGGDRRAPLLAARQQLQAAADALREWPRLDVVFVLYTPDLHQIFLEARRQIASLPPQKAASPAVPPPLADAIRRRECVFFIGAGLSVPAGMPSYGDLMERIAAELGEKVEAKDVGSYLDLAQWYRDQYPSRLPKLIQETFQVDARKVKPTLAHYLLLALPVAYTITTNYDDLVERTLSALRRFPVKVVKNEEVASTGARDGTYVVKFHGDAHTPDTDIVLSRDDYDNFFVQRPVMASLLEGLLLNQTFLFVGYSLRDPNFRLVLSRIHQMLQDAKRDAYAVTFDPVNAHYREQCRRKGLILIEISGRTREEQAQHFICFLDDLSTKASGEASPFLARDASANARDGEQEGRDQDVEGPVAPTAVSKRLQPIRDALWDIGAHIESAHVRASPDEAREMAKVLAFLTENGWRPKGRVRLSKIWEHLADRLGKEGTDADEQRAMLVAALARTESSKDAERLRQRLASGNSAQGLDEDHE